MHMAVVSCFAASFLSPPDGGLDLVIDIQSAYNFRKQPLRRSRREPIFLN